MQSTGITFILAGIMAAAAAWTGCTPPPGGNPEAWPAIAVRVDTLFTLGQDTSAFFIWPDNIVTDSEGRILVSDPGQNKVLVFSGEGEYLYSIGGKGRGPAEFMEMAGLGIDSADVFTVFDRSSQLLKTFRSSGEFIKTTDLGEIVDSSIEFKRWRDYRVMMYLLFRAIPDYSTYPDYIHVYSDRYELAGEGVSQAEFDPSGNEIVRRFIRFFGSFIVNGDELFITPRMYSGYIYRYRLSEEVGQIGIVYEGELQGFVYMGEIGKKVGSGEKEPASWDAMQSTMGNKDYFVLYNQSAGLYRLSSGEAVHFTYLEKPDGKERVFGVELYDAAMQPIGYAPIRTNTRAETSELYELRWLVRWKDEQDQFYITSKERGKSPLIHVVRLEFEVN